MADRFPLIANTSANQIQELSASDNLDLTGNSIIGVSTIGVSTVIVGSGVTITDGNGFFTGIVTATSVIVGSVDVAGIATFRNPVNVEDSITETVFAITDASSVALDPDNGMVQTWTLGANRTATDSLTTGQSMLLIVTSTGSSYTLTWPTMTWKGGSAPTLGGATPTAIELFKVGSTLYGATIGDLG
tara:strand:+ start:115 stop:678 length:564 start_codon:yes stop_codon:yes gene_type:complete